MNATWLLPILALAACARANDPGDRMPGLRENKAVPHLKAALTPLLEEAGFHRVGERWERRRGDATCSVTVGWGGYAVICAGIGYDPILNVLQKAPPSLTLAQGTIPTTELLQVWVTGGLVQAGHDGPRPGANWSGEGMTATDLSAEAQEAFRSHILPFFDRTSTLDAALEEIGNEHQFGDCGPMSAYTPRINKFAVAALYKLRGELDPMKSVIEHELTLKDPDEPWRAFRDWILNP